MVAGTPSSRETKATALPWLPAEQVTTPRRLSSGVSARSRKNAPRILKEPVSCCDSSLSDTGTPAASESGRDSSMGVRRTRPSSARRASRIIAMSSGGMRPLLYFRISDRGSLDVEAQASRNLGADALCEPRRVGGAAARGLDRREHRDRRRRRREDERVLGQRRLGPADRERHDVDGELEREPERALAKRR